MSEDFRSMNEAERRLLRTFAEDELLASPLYRQTRMFLVAAVMLGAVFWGAGTVSTVIQISSVRQEAAAAQASITDLETRMRTIDSELMAQFDRKRDRVSQAAEAAITDIQTKRAAVATALPESELKDLAALRNEISAMREASGKLNLASLRSFVSFTVWLSLFTGPVALVLSLIALTRSRRAKQI